MIHTKVVIGALMSLVLALPAFGKTYKFSYAVPCSQVWDAVKDTLSNQDNYAGVKSDDAHLTADYSPKHSVHFDVSGVILQRTNHVTLIAAAEGCDMNVVELQRMGPRRPGRLQEARRRSAGQAEVRDPCRAGTPRQTCEASRARETGRSRQVIAEPACGRVSAGLPNWLQPRHSQLENEAAEG